MFWVIRTGEVADSRINRRDTKKRAVNVWINSKLSEIARGWPKSIVSQSDVEFEPNVDQRLRISGKYQIRPSTAWKIESGTALTEADGCGKPLPSIFKAKFAEDFDE
jgi:hypothetical protein